MKRLSLHRVIIVMALLMTTLSRVQAFDVDGMSYSTISGTEVRLTKGLNQAEVVIPSTVTYNGVTYSVTEISQQAFLGYKNTRKVIIPGSVQTIGREAFYDNYYLEEVELNEGLEKIETGAFQFNFALKEIRIPSTVLSIGNNSFYTNQDSNIGIYCYAATPPTITSNTFGGRTNNTLYVVASDIELYQEASYWNAFSSISVDANRNRCFAPVISFDNYRLSMTTQTEEATIYYSTDGSQPDETSIRYTAPISYITNLPIRAIAIAEGFENSAIRTFNTSLDFLKTDAALSASLSDDHILTINCEASYILGVPEVTVWWYQDGNYYSDWEEYVGPVKLEHPGIIHVYAKREGWIPTAEQTYDFYTNYYTEAPTITWNKEEGKVSITHKDPDVDIYYTLDGTDPSVETSLYSEPIIITKNTEVRAIAIRNGKFDSDMAVYKVSDIITRFYVNGIYYNISGNLIDEVVVSDGQGASGDVVIPAIITYLGQSYKVIDISYRAFKDNITITSVSIPNTIKGINEEAFSGCSSLAKVVLEEGAGYIGRRAFYRCSALTKIVIPGTVQSIGDGAFWYSGVTEVYFNEGLKYIGKDVFSNDADNVWRSNYNNYRSIQNEIILPQTLISIGDRAFKGNHKIPKVKFQEGLTTIGEGAFQSCYSLNELLLPNSLKNIGESAFYDCRNLNVIILPDNIQAINNNVFKSCTSLYSVKFPSSLLKIGDNSFQDCASLTFVSLPENVTTIGNRAFYACSSLQGIYSFALIPPAMNSGNGFTGLSTQAKLYVDSSVLQAYKQANCWAEFKTILPIEQYPCEPPVLSLTEDLTLIMKTETDGATIYYTTDGSEPSNLSLQYTSPIQVLTSGVVFRAIAICDGYNNSQIVDYEVSLKVQTPKVTISEDYMVTITCDSPNIPSLPEVEIEYYGFGPDENAITTYAGPFQLPYCETEGRTYLYVKAKREGWQDSEVNSVQLLGTYITDIPYITWDSNAHKVSITHDNAAAKLFFTLDGSTPTTSSNYYSGPFTLDRNNIVKAIASVDGKINSPVKIKTVSGFLKESFIVDGIYYQLSDSSTINEVEVLNGKNYEGHLVIPEKVTYDGVTYTVIGIADYALSYNRSLKSIVIPNTVRYISHDAFQGCNALTEIDIPGSVKNIGDNAFLFSVLKKVTFHEGLEYIGKNAFSGNHSNGGGNEINQSIEFPSTIKIIEEHAFENNPNLSGEIVFPEGMIKIGGGAFNNTGITSVFIPSTIMAFSFRGCSKLQSVKINGPLKIREIEYGAFQGCGSLISIIIPEGIEKIGDWSFSDGCTSLTSVSLPSTLKSIGQGSFYGCKALPTISFPANLSQIGDDAFEGCSSLNTVYSYNMTPPALGGFDSLGDVVSHATLYVNNLAVNSYKKAQYWNGFSSIKEIGESAIDKPVFAFDNELYLLTIASEIDGATIYYTDDGTIPTIESKKYVAPIPFVKNDTIYAIAVVDGMGSSSIATFIKRDFKVATPVATLSEDLKMSITCEANALETFPVTKIYYQKNKKNNNYEGFSNWILYEGPVQLTEPGHVRTLAMRDGWINSEWGQYNLYDGYVFDKPVLDEVPEKRAVVLTHSDPEAKIYYTLDGTKPTMASMLYTDSIHLEHNSIVTAIAAKDRYFNTDTISRSFGWFTVAQPQINISKNVATIICEEPATAQIYYTINNTIPTEESAKYTGPIVLERDCNIKAFAVAEDWYDAPVASYRYRTAEHTCQAPRFSLYATDEDGQIHLTKDSLYITTPTEDATIYYTMNGDEPSVRSTRYEGLVKLTENCNVRAIAVRNDMMDSEVAEKAIDWFTVETPQIEFEGKYCTITTETTDATIYYTIDESEPTSKSQFFTGRVALPAQQTVVKAIAVKENWNNSQVRNRTYNPGGNFCEAPVIARVVGTDSIQMSTRTENTTIYYTLNGLNPTVSDSIYTKPFCLPHNGTLKAMTTNPIYYDSEVTSFNVNWYKAAQPVITVEDKVVTMTCATEGAEIHYTLDGSEPTEENTVYHDQLTMTGNCTIKAIASYENFNNSSIAKVEYRTSEHACSVPEFTRQGDSISIAALPAENTTIYYTTDGTEPTSSSEIYVRPVKVQENCVIKAVASNPKLFQSESGNYDVNWFKVDEPEINFDGIYATITCSMPNSKIRYTLDGTTPTDESPLYSGRLTMSSSCNVKAVAMREHFNNSSVVTMPFDKEQNTIGRPVFQREGNVIRITASPVEGTTIYYTTDGTEPNKTSRQYADSLAFSENCVVKAFAVNEKMFSSEISSYDVDWFKVSTPEITFDGIVATLSSSTPNCRIYYTLDGSAPTNESLKYQDALTMTGSCTIKAIGIRDNFHSSSVATAAFDKDQNMVGKPQFQRMDSTLSIAASPSDGTVIYYTTDGTEPNTKSEVYVDRIKFESNCTVRAIASNPKMFTSSESSYDVNWYKAETPVITFDGIVASISCATPNSRIYYTLDGSVPTGESLRYEGSLTMSTTCTLKAVALRTGYNSSSVVSAAFSKDDNTVSKPVFQLKDSTLLVTASPADGTVIYYTLDGSAPNTGSLVYQDGIRLSGNGTVRCFAVNEKMFSSEISSYDVDWFKVSTPEITFDGIVATLSSSTPNSRIYYTLDGSAPTNESLKYQDALTMTGSCTIKAIGIRDNFHSSSVATAAFDKDQNTISRPLYQRTDDQVSITASPVEGTTIYYTTDGTDPNIGSAVYKEAITLEGNCTVKAFAVNEKMFSSETSSYDVNWFKVETPEVTFDGIRLSMSCTTPNSRIFYTLDGTTPTEESLRYTNVLTMTNSCTVKAIAVKDNYHNSTVVTSMFEREANTAAMPEFQRSGNVISLISASSEGTIVYYTMDGSIPTTGSKVYDSPITVTENMTLKALAANPKLFTSEISTYEVDWFKVETPVITLNDETVTISCSTPGATVYYAFGETPTTSSEVYKEPIHIIDNRSVYTFAVRKNYNNSEMTMVTPDKFVCDAVTFEYNGRYLQMQSNEGAIIYYTLDGTKPTAMSTEYVGPVSMDELCTVKAVAMRRDFRDSPATSYVVGYLYNGEEVKLEEGGHLQDVFEWISGAATMVALPVKGKINAVDLTYIHSLKSVRHLDLSEAVFEGDKLPDEAFANMPIVSFQSPKQLASAGEHLFKGCDQLAAIVWNANIAIPESAVEDVKQNPNLLLYVNSRIYAPTSYRGNLISGGEATSITLKDTDEGGNFCCPVRFYTQQISYTHNYTQQTVEGVTRGWETLSLPFDVATITHESRGSMAPFAKGEDVMQYKPFWLYELKETGFFRAADIKAYTPYILSMPNNPAYADDYNLAGKVTFSATNLYIEEDMSLAAMKGSVKFAPAMQRQTKNGDVLTINLTDCTVDGVFYPSGSAFLPDMREVRPFEAYATTGASARSMMLDEYLWGEVTDMQHVEMNKLKSFSKHRGVYDLSGRRLANDSSMLKGKTHQQKVYVVNGKKVRIK